MFERFTQAARDVVSGAVEWAERRDAAVVGEDELLLALLDRTDTKAARVLDALGARDHRASIERSLDESRRRAGLSAADTEALAELGIDVGAIVARVEQAHGVGALTAGRPGRPGRARRTARRPFSPQAKSVLERSLRCALGRGDRHIGDEHLLLALTARPGSAVACVLADHGVGHADVQRALGTAA